MDYINEQSGINLTPVFNQYLKYKNIPILDFMFMKGQLYCRWIADVKDFNMPVKVRIKGSEYQFIKPTTRFEPVELTGAAKDNIDADTFNYYIGVLID